MNALTKVIYSILRAKYDIKMVPKGAKKPAKKGKKKAKRSSSKGSSDSDVSDGSAYKIGYQSSDSEF
jgi:hypothetical protein